MGKPEGLKNKYDVYEVGKKLGLSYQSVCKLCRSGELKSMKVGQKIYITKRDFDIYINEGDIFSKPEKIILDTIKQAIAESIKENIERLEVAVKQKIINELEDNIKKNLVKISRNNKELKKLLPKKTIKNLRYREDTLKKEFEKVKD